MYQIDVASAATALPASSAAGTPGFFTDGNPAAGVPATIVPAEYMNAVMLEILNVMAAASIAPAKDNHTQLLSAINAIVKNGSAPVATTEKSGVVELATAQEGIDGVDTVRAIVPAVLAVVLSSYAKLSSPALTGNPTAPTAEFGANNTQIANTAFMQAGIAALISGASGGLAATPAGLAAVLQGAMMTYAVGSGSANAHTATYTPAVSTLVDGMVLRFRAANANTGAATFSPNGLAAKPIVKRDLSALTGGEISTGRDVWLQWNAALDSWVMTSGGQDILDSVRIDVASAATVDLTVAAPNTRHINITGTTAISAFTVEAGRCYFVRFAGALTLTNGASLVTNTGGNITTAAGDSCVIRATAPNIVEVMMYAPFSHPLLREYVSAQQVMTAGGLLTLAHGLGVVPKLIEMDAVCVSDDCGYVAGDIVQMPPSYGQSSGPQAYKDATSVYIKFGSGGVGGITNKTTGISVGMSAGKWKLIVRAWA